VEGQRSAPRSGEHRGVILLLLLVAATLGLGGFLAVDYIWRLPPMPRLRRWFHRGLVVAALAPFVWWFGGALNARWDYAAERDEVRRYYAGRCGEACGIEHVELWQDDNPAPGWLQW
jgi:hypothetical protein